MSEKKIILFLDDQENWRKTITGGLREFEVRSVGSIEEFQEVLQSGDVKPNLFLIDWLLSPAGDSNAEPLIRDLLRDYPDIPRVILTSGQGEPGTAGRIAELQCAYIEKGSGLAALRDVIELNSQEQVVNENEPELTREQEAFYKGTLLEIEKRKKELDQQNSKLEEKRKELEQQNSTLRKQQESLQMDKNVLEEQQKELKRQKGVLEERQKILEGKNTDLELQQKRLQREKDFFERFIGVSKGIVDETLDLTQFAGDLLQNLVEYSDCLAGVIVSFRDGAGVLVDREMNTQTMTDANNHVQERTIFKIMRKRISVSDFSKIHHIQFLMLKSEDQSGDQTKNQRLQKLKAKFNKWGIGKRVFVESSIILPNFQNDSEAFTKIRLAEIKRRTNLLLIPIKTNGAVIGAILLFDKVVGQCFDKLDQENIEKIPLSDMISGAAEMPFRTYDQKGLFKSILRVVTRLSSRVSLNVKPWDIKRFFISTYMELLRISVAIISIAVISVPIYLVVKHFLHPVPGHTLHIDVLGSIELLLMLLTFILFSLGLVILFEPSYARGLPRWMFDFTRISTLEGTLLRLVVIILAIHILGRFLDSMQSPDNSTVRYSPFELLIISVSICFIAIVFGVFTKYFLHEEAKDDEDI